MRRASLVIVVCAGLVPGLLRAQALAPNATAEVLRVVDGDTVVITTDARPVTVRLIGVDTPETVHPRKPVERFGREASAFLKTLVAGKPVRVEYEPGSSHLDKYGRTLAYLYLEPGGLCINREIIARGYGHAYTRYPFALMDDFRAAERAAREGQIGLWGPDDTTPEPTVEATVFITRTGTKYHRSDCRYLAGDSTTMPLAGAPARYRPCAVCDPLAPAEPIKAASASVASQSL